MTLLIGKSSFPLQSLAVFSWLWLGEVYNSQFFVTRDWDCYIATFCCLSQFLPLYQAIYYWVLENALPHTSAEKTWHIIGLVKKSSSQMLRRYFVMLPPIRVGKTILPQRKYNFCLRLIFDSILCWLQNCM